MNNVTTHVAQNDGRAGGSAIDARTTRWPGYAINQRSREGGKKKRRNRQPICLTLGLHPTRLPSARSATYLIRLLRFDGASLLTFPSDFSDVRSAVLLQLFYDTVRLSHTPAWKLALLFLLSTTHSPGDPDRLIEVSFGGDMSMIDTH